LKTTVLRRLYHKSQSAADRGLWITTWHGKISRRGWHSHVRSQNSSTARLSSKRVIRKSLNIPLYLKRVTTLPANCNWC